MIELPTVDKQSDERQMLLAFLNYQRAVFERKCGAVADPNGRLTVQPSDLSVGGLVKHLAFVESYWSSYIVAGEDPQPPWADAPWDDDPDWELTSGASDSMVDNIELYRASRTAADAIYDRVKLDDLTARSTSADDADLASVRWVLLHLIEEYARHNGHADYLCQAIDGATGD